jgi:hypothetical protein
MQIKRDFAGSTDMWPTSAGGQLIEVANLTGFTVYIYLSLPEKRKAGQRHLLLNSDFANCVCM